MVVRRTLVIALVVAAVAGSLALPVAADSPDGAQPASYTYEELAQSGDRQEGLLAGEHWLGQYGTVTLTYEPVDPKSPAWVYLKPGEKIRATEVTIDAIRLGDNFDRTLNVTVVAWEKGETIVPAGNTTKTIPAAENVSSFTKTITLERGRDEATISLPTRYGETYQISMWIEEEAGARWRFQMHPVPFGQPMNIDSQGDFWMTAFLWIIGPSILGIFGGTIGGKRALDQIKVGTGYGFKFYGFITFVSLLIGVLFLWYQTIVVLDRAPYIVGGGMMFLTLVTAIEILDRRADIVAFERDELQDAKSPAGDDVKDTLYQEIQHHRVVEEDGELYFVPRGIINALARFWADPPRIPMEDLKTQIQTKGAIARKFIADPTREEVLDFKPARFGITSPLRDLDLDEDAGLAERLQIVRWPLLAKSIFAFAGVMIGFDLWFGLKGLATLLGLIAAATVWIETRDGEAEFEPAPVHMTEAKASIITGATKYDDAATLEDAEKQMYAAYASTASDVRDAKARQDETVTERLNKRELGFDPMTLQDGEDDE